MQQPQVDILVPIYGVEAHIERCIRSFLSQDYPALRIVLVDDASPDHSLEIAERFLKEENPYHHKYIIVRQEKNQGIGAVRSLLLNFVEGKYTLFLDSDDYWDNPHTLTEWVDIAEKGNYDVVIADYIHEYPRIGEKHRVKMMQRTDGKAEAYACLMGDTEGYLWNKLILSEELLKYRHLTMEGRDLWEDLAITTPLLYNAGRIGYYPKPAYHYVHHGDTQYTAQVKPSYIGLLHELLEDLARILPSEKDHRLKIGLNYAIFRAFFVVAQLPFGYYRELREADFHVERALLPNNPREWLKYFSYRLASSKGTSFVGFLLIRGLLSVYRMKRSKRIYQA